MRTPTLAARVVAASLLAALAAHPALAQRSTAPSGLERRNVLSINPLGVPFEYVSAEYEGVVVGAFTLGGAFSYFSPSDESYTSFEVKGRLYPAEEGPKGFSVGLGAGIAHVSERNVFFDGARRDVSATRPTIHIFADYNWLLGKSGRFYVGSGVGAKRILGLKDSDFDDVFNVYPTARFQIGATF